MPLYEYQCDSCGQRFERIQRFSDSPVEVCTSCGKSPVTKLISAPGIHFKGSGWYITDYTKGSSSAAGSDKSAPTKPSTETNTEGKAEGKAEGKTEGQTEGKTKGQTETSTKAESKPASTPESKS